MIDLIDECANDLSAYGYKTKALDRFGICEGSMVVDSRDKAEKLGFEKGEYYIINSPFVYDLGDECHDFMIKLLSRRLNNILKNLRLSKTDRYLIVGIGNPDILADSLGKKVLDKIFINPFEEENNIFKIAPNIFLNTGMSTYELVALVANAQNVDCVILIDSLATQKIDRLGISFQLNSAGITPGSAMLNKNKKIDFEALGIPCISFGVPFMVFAQDLAETKNKDLVLAPKDIHQNIDISSKIIARAISLSLEIEEGV